MASDPALRLSDLPVGGLRRVVVNGRAICLARIDDETVFAVADACSHEEASLSEGELLGREVECPLHLSRFDLETGEVMAPPAMAPVATYPLSIEDGAVYVDVS